MDTMQSRNALRAEFLIMLLSDGSVGSDRICFTSKDETLLNHFENITKKLFSIEPKKYRKKRGVTELRIYSKKLVKELFTYNKSYRTKGCEVYPECNKKSCKECKPIIHNGIKYPPANLPEVIKKLPKKYLRNTLQVLMSAEGGITLSPRVSKPGYLCIERKVFLACKHPSLIKGYKKLFEKFGLNLFYDVKAKSFVIKKSKEIEKFKNEIGFLPGVKVTLSTSKWCNIQKNKILDFVVECSKMPKGFWKKFHDKDELVNFVEESLTHAKPLQCLHGR